MTWGQKQGEDKLAGIIFLAVYVYETHLSRVYADKVQGHDGIMEGKIYICLVTNANQIICQLLHDLCCVASNHARRVMGD